MHCVFDLKFGTNNGTDDTCKHARFTVIIGFHTFSDMTSQKFPFHNGMSHRDLIFTPWNQEKLKKNQFLCLDTSFWHNFMHFHGFEVKQKIRMNRFC